MGVVVEAEGDAEAVAALLARIGAEAPPLAVVARVASAELTPTGQRGFAIVPSVSAVSPDAAVAADTAPCADCLAELWDPADRRHRYAFINCTNCGPRFTIVRGVPYDRPLTAMAGFAMCEACRSEYEDPGDRRFHAEPIACPACGPRVWEEGGGGDDAGDDAIRSSAAALRAGSIVAVKGIGGFHLACRADDEAAVARLRARKHREDRPFALMAPDLAGAHELVELDAVAEALLVGPQRPIVLAPRRAHARVAAAVAPGARELGVMLPYAPLHHLLLADAGCPLVLTSGNVSDEPIAYRDDDARRRLAGIADRFLLHDRPIETRTDDTVLRVADGRARMLRRSRGYVPAALALPVPARRPLLACGAQQKNTFCVARGERAWVSHHIGDLENYETLASFGEGIGHFERLFAVDPAVVAHDLHPDYLSTRYALERAGVEPVGVQHHHAHLVAVLAEHGEIGPALGAIFDGTGYGTDGAVWGGELLLGSLSGFDRIDHLPPVRMPGGAAAVRQPWRMACAWLAELDGGPPARPASLATAVDEHAWVQVAQLAIGGLASPPTTSMGRFLDAVAALCGVRAEVTYEGQAAIELEAACDPAERGRYPCERLDVRPALAALRGDLRAGAAVPTVAARVHNTIAAATADALLVAAGAHGVHTAVLSGGVFQNRRLLEQTARRARAGGLRVLLPERLPANDGAISFGQAAIAAARG